MPSSGVFTVGQVLRYAPPHLDFANKFGDGPPLPLGGDFLGEYDVI